MKSRPKNTKSAEKHEGREGMMVARKSLVAALWVADVVQRLASDVAGEVGAEEVDHAVTDVGGGVAVVGDEQHVVEIPERRAGREWLFDEGIKIGTADLAAAQGVDHGWLIDNEAAPDVDEVGGGFHGLEGGGVEQFFGGGGDGEGDDEIVGLGEVVLEV